MSWFSSKKIFLDYASATPVLLRVQWAMWKYFSREFYNPNAIYEEGAKVRREVEAFRTQIARICGVAKDSVIFTSGGTESNTWAVRGVKSGQVIVEPDSHPSVSEAVLPSRSKKVVLVSSPVADNKLGRKIREERKKNNSDYPLLHIDASQTANYFDIKLESLACDILTLDSAKFYGPKGIGALIVRKGVKLDLPPQGTPPVSLIAGFAKALEISVRDREKEFKRLSLLSNQFAETLKQRLPEASVSVVEPNIVNLSVPPLLPEFLVLLLDKKCIQVSAGPACLSSKPEPVETPVRFSLGRYTTRKELSRALEILCREVQNVLK